MKRENKVSRGLMLAVLFGYGAWVVFPMLWVAYSSLKADSAIFSDAFALPVPGDKEEDTTVAHWRARIAPQAARFGTIHETTLGVGHFDIAPPASADLIVTFRNFHNWVQDGDAPEALAACLRALKPGGVLGIEDHRGRDDRPQDPKAKYGYVRQDYVINLVKQAGFEFVGSSEINANPKDTKDWPKGVWTLPPTLELGDQDRAKYVAIGEADNFVLKFRKPKHG